MKRAVSSRDLGAKGEVLAACFLEERGMKILDTNVRCRMGELDIVARDGGTVVFVEVKTKSGGRYGPPEEMVTAAKQRRLTALGQSYLQRMGWSQRPARFDVVAVEWRPGQAPEVRHHRGAFTSDGAW